MKRLIKRIKNKLKELYVRFRGRESKKQQAIRKAKRMSKKTGRRYRVFFFGLRYHAWNRDDIRRYQKSGLFREGLKAGNDFDTICFYDTQNPEKYVSDKR